MSEGNRDRELGMRRRITRRDFLNGVAVGIGALGCAGLPDLASGMHALTAGVDSPKDYPPALSDLRGSAPGSFDVAHALRDGTFWDTAGSAAEIKERGDPTVAAIASELAGRIYGLVSLKQNIEDAEHNTTRFLIMSREPQWAPRGGHAVTTFVFNVRNVPAALYKALGGFATNAVNMTKLESYMVEGNFTATQFYADVEAHPDDRPLKLALEELAFFSTEVKIVGVYPAHPLRIAARQEERGED